MKCPNCKSTNYEALVKQWETRDGEDIVGTDSHPQDDMYKCLKCGYSWYPTGHIAAETVDAIGRIDGLEFRKQRLIVVAIAERFPEQSEERELLDGLTTLCDVIADIAHDKHGVNCIIKENDEVKLRKSANLPMWSSCEEQLGCHRPAACTQNDTSCGHKVFTKVRNCSSCGGRHMHHTTSSEHPDGETWICYHCGGKSTDIDGMATSI